jgi:hypothetical protein
LFCDMTPFDYALGMFHNGAIIEIAVRPIAYSTISRLACGVARSALTGRSRLSAIVNPNLAPDAHTKKPAAV